MKIKRALRAIVVKWLIRFFVQGIKYSLMWERAMAIQDDCKHEGQTGTFCGICGKALKNPEDVETEAFLDASLERILTKHGVIKPKPAGAPTATPKTNLAKRLMKKEGK